MSLDREVRLELQRAEKALLKIRKLRNVQSIANELASTELEVAEQAMLQVCGTLEAALDDLEEQIID